MDKRQDQTPGEQEPKGTASLEKAEDMQERVDQSKLVKPEEMRERVSQSPLVKPEEMGAILRAKAAMDAAPKGRGKRRRRLPGDSRYQLGLEYAGLLLGSLIVAASFNLFLNPNHVASGGVTGISIIVNHLTGVQPAYIQWLLNIPLFLLGLRQLGRSFGLKTLVGSIALPLFVLLLSGLPPATDNLLLATIYGGIGVGLGLGMVFRSRGSTGGLDLAAQLVHRWTGISLGLAVPLLDGMVITAAGFVFNPEKALFALIGLYVTGKTIDFLQSGISVSRVAFIISGRTEEISQAILVDLDRGLTKLSGEGGYTGTERMVLMVVLRSTEVSRLKAIVKRVDPNAFVIISDTKEVLGEGFQPPG